MRAGAEVARDHTLSRVARLQPIRDIVAYFEAAHPDVRTNRRDEIARSCDQLAQARDPGSNHVLLGPLPPAVDRQSGAALAIAYQDRDAIGDFDGDAGPLLPGGNGVPFGAQEARAIA